MANFVYTDNNGIIVADTSDIKTEVQTEMQAALGDDISLEDGTPQGRLIDMETEARSQVAINNAYIANMWNFSTSTGLALDAWGSNFGLTRNPATASRVTATVTGVAGTVISQGSTASTQEGNIFYAENNITIGIGGSATGVFVSKEKGEISCPANSLTKIIDGTLGWETITNANAAVIGTKRQSDESFKQEFYNSGLFLGFSLWQDYENALNQVDGVISSYIYDNGEDSAVTIDTGLSVPKHSLYACIDGGSDTDVAMALLNRKSVGCDWGGTTTSVTVTEPVYGNSVTVKFDRPTEIEIYSAISIDTSNSSLSDPAATVKQAVSDYVNKLKVGGDVYPFQIAQAINSAAQGVRITSLTINKYGVSPATSPITIHLNEVAKISDLDNITVTII